MDDLMVMFASDPDLIEYLNMANPPYWRKFKTWLHDSLPQEEE